MLCCLTFAVGDLHSKKALCVCTSGENPLATFLSFSTPGALLSYVCSILIIKSRGPTLSHLVTMQPTRTKKAAVPTTTKPRAEGFLF